MVELPSGPYLQDDVDVAGIVEAAVHLDDVGMVQEHLDFDLTRELVRYLLFSEQTLLDDLQGADEVAIPLADQIDSPVLAVAQLFDLHEVLNTHPTSLPRDIPQSR
jgi:hypothetical protein